jgi:hypothetical protein
VAQREGTDWTRVKRAPEGDVCSGNARGGTRAAEVVHKKKKLALLVDPM